MEEAIEVLLYSKDESLRKVIKANIKKEINVLSVIPEEMEKFPWAGHLGIKMANKAVEIIQKSKSSLIFTNTRAQCEIWYQKLLETEPDLAGQIARHHGSISKDIREWVEEALHSGKLKAVVCTASLDLGVDFRPVDTVIQVGSPKGVARFMQRAGRSGHSPHETSRIYFLPTNTLELLEVAALKTAIEQSAVESKEPMLLCFDVLLQYCCTIAAGQGFNPSELLAEISSTHCFSSISQEEWNDIIFLLTRGGKALQQYDEYEKLQEIDGRIYCSNRRVLFAFYFCLLSRKIPSAWISPLGGAARATSSTGHTA
jgi:ATP-dependent Lhr-like helicase